MVVAQTFGSYPWMRTFWWVTLWVLYVPEVVMSFWLRSAGDAKKADKGSKAVVIVAAMGCIWLASGVASRFPRLQFGEGWRVAFFVGMALWIGGIVMRWYAIRVLGKFFTFDVAISKGQTVVEAGPYRWIRHPSYTGSLISFFGVGLTYTNWAAMLVPLVCMMVAYGYRIPVEEKALCEGLGQPYVDYMQRTWRLFPGIY